MRRILKVAGFVVLVIFVGFGALFAAGSAADDPGGWKAAGLIASWALPMIALGVLAWHRPAPLTTWLTVVTLGVVGLNAWAASHGSDWSSLEDQVGPIRAIVSIAIAGPIAILGLKRVAPAGAMLVALGVMPYALSAWSAELSSAPLRVICVPITLSGVLYLFSAWLSRGEGTHGHARSNERASSHSGVKPKPA